MQHSEAVKQGNCKVPVEPPTLGSAGWWWHRAQRLGCLNTGSEHTQAASAHNYTQTHTTNHLEQPKAALDGCAVEPRVVYVPLDTKTHTRAVTHTQPHTVTHLEQPQAALDGCAVEARVVYVPLVEAQAQVGARMQLRLGAVLPPAQGGFGRFVCVITCN